MKSYRVVEFGAPLAAVDAPTPQPSGTEVLLRVKAAGVCHSDLHIWEGGYDLGHGQRLSLKDRGIPLPLTMGHETVGEVLAAGLAEIRILVARGDKDRNPLAGGGLIDRIERGVGGRRVTALRHVQPGHRREADHAGNRAAQEPSDPAFRRAA